jgi:rsbT co-antagonist protein RsbR
MIRSRDSNLGVNPGNGRSMQLQNAAVDALLNADKQAFVAKWIAQSAAGSGRARGSQERMAADAHKLLAGLEAGIRASGDPARFDAEAWSPLRDALAELSDASAAQGMSAGETSRFVLAIKRPLFDEFRTQYAKEPQALIEGVWWSTTLADNMAELTVTTYQRAREAIIARQQQDLLELSTPVIKLWDGVLAVPMIGTLDSSRTQIVMEALLQRIVETESGLAIIDITGVPTVDTLVAQHLIKTVTAIRLMGAECIVSGIRPQIAQTIVHLGIDLTGITTKATLADALSVALRQTGHVITRAKA